MVTFQLVGLTSSPPLGRGDILTPAPGEGLIILLSRLPRDEAVLLVAPGTLGPLSARVLGSCVDRTCQLDVDFVAGEPGSRDVPELVLL